MKSTNEIEGNENFDDILNEASNEEKAFGTKSLQISTQILEILEKKKMLQKDFAEMMGKSEAEISKWLSGFHNFTVKTISNIELVLGESIIITPKQVLTSATKEIEALISRINDLDTLNYKAKETLTNVENSTFSRVLNISEVTKPIKEEGSNLPLCA
jgi:transcriptional regulator with XRE-family HTH domain